jgi:hypothetical protein
MMIIIWVLKMLIMLVPAADLAADEDIEIIIIIIITDLMMDTLSKYHKSMTKRKNVCVLICL